MKTSLSDMITREREFAQFSYDHGVKKAFLTYLNETSVMFRPNPVPGRSIYEKYPDELAAMLRWTPEYADCAQSGDIGYTFGPWQYSKKKDASPVAYGHYFTVWEKTTIGWFIYIDAGISYTDGNDLSVPCITESKTSIGVTSNIVDIEAFESALAVLSFEKGYESSVAHFAAKDSVIFREEHKPMTKIEFLYSKDESMQSEEITQSGIKIAQSMDLYAVYGSIKTAGSHLEKASYIRVVKRNDDDWEIVADVRLEYPNQKEQ